MLKIGCASSHRGEPCGLVFPLLGRAAVVEQDRGPPIDLLSSFTPGTDWQFLPQTMPALDQ